MRIHPKIIIKTYLKKKSPTWARVTLGETDTVRGDISLYAKQISERAITLQDRLPRYSINQLGLELYYLVLFHELHHSLHPKTTEKTADQFAWHTFKAFFSRYSVIPRRLWRDLPTK